MKRGLVEGENRVWVAVTDEPLDLAAASGFVADPSAGCTVTFTGTVRDHSGGRTGVTHLEYEAYAGVVESKIDEIVGEALDRWHLVGVAALHRTGTVELTQPSVLVAVSAAHRADAFPAARYIIDELKARAPIWKKEHWQGGAEWVEGA
jgi:molybdopterin synthase catalytic subunit